MLARLDYVVASVHSSFGQDEAVMTSRIIRALEHPRTTMLGHLTGRLLLEREAYRVDAGKVIDAAIANGVAIELNANPHPARHGLAALEAGRRARPGVLDQPGRARHARTWRTSGPGINSARKGWLTRENVVNTLPLKAIEAWLARKRGRR